MSEDDMPCGLCCVCDEPVDHSKAGFCYVCQQPFHWTRCGGWGKSKDHTYGRTEHICDNCKTEEDEE